MVEAPLLNLEAPSEDREEGFCAAGKEVCVMKHRQETKDLLS